MEANTWKERIIMPIQNGKYVSPNWQNGGPPALNAAELNAICQSLQADDQQIKDNLPGIIQSIASGVFLNSSGQLVNKAGSQITVPSSQLSDQVHIVTGSYVGTGTFGADHPCSLTFNFVPKFLLVYCNSDVNNVHYIFAVNPSVYYVYDGYVTRPELGNITWGKTVQYYTNSNLTVTYGQCNTSNHEYIYFAVG